MVQIGLNTFANRSDVKHIKHWRDEPWMTQNKTDKSHDTGANIRQQIYIKLGSLNSPRNEFRLWSMGSTVGSAGVISCEDRGIGVSVMTGLDSGDFSMGLSSSRSWWIHRSGGLRSLEFPLYLWEPLVDLQAARFLQIFEGIRVKTKRLVGGRESDMNDLG